MLFLLFAISLVSGMVFTGALNSKHQSQNAN
jgi:hypothetical protein